MPSVGEVVLWLQQLKRDGAEDDVKRPHYTVTEQGDRLTDGERLTLIMIASHYRRSGFATISMADLALETGLSKKQQRRILRGLEGKHLVQTSQRGFAAPHHTQDANAYRLLMDLEPAA